MIVVNMLDTAMCAVFGSPGLVEFRMVITLSLFSKVLFLLFSVISFQQYGNILLYIIFKI